ncbi:uncharacterized protein Z518_04473 [Rhinocladiella mackenziei CBS 650.93]|uniref:Uncharacterized protein n=1 Tax=Rhinocladiella mackenziei CBS 650.93 TaxID=1442369 RepID=A0A0D2FWE8_9EURO|nr:uncharacterized protein Z518_04473 [Rhinocladiella mackenziei CBS 650.93]KIX06497.1 hypothetical protein Z518_04473 [Rhinocladiella mackenziei CBS 650.93]
MASGRISSTLLQTNVVDYVREGSRVASRYGSQTAEQVQKAVMEHGSKAAAVVGTFAVENPVLTGLTVLGVSVVAAPGIFSTSLLSAAGFGAGGVQASSVAATIQGGIGNVVAGSPFAIAQSAGAGGYGAAIVNGIAQLCGGVMASGSAGIAWIRST